MFEGGLFSRTVQFMLILQPSLWPHYGKNTQSVGELWMGFFRYYLETFNFLDQVVTIRRFIPLTKFEKLWNGKCIAIEGNQN